MRKTDFSVATIKTYFAQPTICHDKETVAQHVLKELSDLNTKTIVIVKL